jgi:hypothetical protein
MPYRYTWISQARYYLIWGRIQRTPPDKEPVADFIDSLAIGSQAKVLRLIDLLAKYGVLLKEPYTKKLKGN